MTISNQRQNPKPKKEHAMLRPGDEIEFSISPPDLYQQFVKRRKKFEIDNIEYSYTKPCNYKDRKNDFHMFWSYYFKTEFLGKGLKSYKMYLELSPLGRLHYHGRAEILDPEEFLNTLFFLSFDVPKGIEHSRIRDEQKVNGYIKKDHELMRYTIDSAKHQPQKRILKALKNPALQRTNRKNLK